MFYKLIEKKRNEWLSLDCEQADENAPWHSSVEVYIDKNGYSAISITKNYNR